jgi:hypothetical protein
MAFSTRARRLIVAALILWGAAGGAYVALHAAFGYRPSFAHVRWAADVDEAARLRLERTYALTAPRQQDTRTWSYWLTDVSRRNIRALVEDAAVEDTHYLHRTQYRPWRTAPRGAYPGASLTWIARALELLIALLVGLGAAAIGLAVLAVIRLPAVAQAAFDRVTALFVEPRRAIPPATRATVGWLERRIPQASARAVGIFRIAFGLCLLPYFVWKSVGPEWLERAAAESSLQAYFTQVYEAAPAVTAWITPWIVVWCVLFILGLWSRTSYAMLTAGVMAWAFVYTARVGSHQVQVPIVAMLCMLWSRWGDALSVDAWLRRRRPAADSRAQSRVYGYTMWVPGVVIGLAFAAAAFAKIRESGIAWITNGSVKYHFLSDGNRAPVDWGLRLAQNDLLAILMSFTGVALEASVIVLVCCSAYRYRLAGGLGVIALVMSFWLFQGLFWPFWTMLALSFLPWHRVGAGSAAARSGTTVAAAPLLRWAQALTPVLLVGVQVVASANRIEYAPFVSAWDMYSTTYASTAEYEQKAAMQYVITASLHDGTAAECSVVDDQARAIAALWGRSLPSDLQAVIDACFSDTRRIRQIAIVGRRSTFDWDRWRVAEQVSVPITEPIEIELLR